LKYYAGVDVGGTTSTVAISDDDRRVRCVSEQFPTLAGEPPSRLIAAIVAAIRASIESLDADMRQIAAVGLSTPGPATLDGVLLNTPNFKAPGWDRFAIRGELESAFRRQALDGGVHYIGDGQAAALGEYAIRTGSLAWDKIATGGSDASRAACSLQSLFMVVVGTGLGGGEVRDGQVVRGHQGRAGHAGHVLLPDYAFRHAHDRELLVGNALSTAESAVSLTGLAHQLGYRLSLDAWRDHPLNREPGTTLDKAKRLRGLADDDPLALELFDDQARALGIALLSINYVGDYDLLVIGGGVCDLSAHVRERYRSIVASTYERYALDGFKTDVCFEFSKCGDAAPVIGALAQAYAGVNET
jgi:predicted NBD/HSP70 family sugar kinase